MIDRCKSRVGGGDVAKQTAKQGIGRVKERMNERRRERRRSIATTRSLPFTSAIPVCYASQAHDRNPLPHVKTS
jgi:hypothetical protein